MEEFLTFTILNTKSPIQVNLDSIEEFNHIGDNTTLITKKSGEQLKVQMNFDEAKESFALVSEFRKRKNNIQNYVK